VSISGRVHPLERCRSRSSCRASIADDARGGELVFDDTVLITSYVDPDVLDEGKLRELRRFLHRLGREGRQGEVGIVIGGSYYGITEFDDGEA
jgi:hypothetical protein